MKVEVAEPSEMAPGTILRRALRGSMAALQCQPSGAPTWRHPIAAWPIALRSGLAQTDLKWP